MSDEDSNLQQHLNNSPLKKDADGSTEHSQLLQQIEELIKLESLGPHLNQGANKLKHEEPENAPSCSTDVSPKRDGGNSTTSPQNLIQQAVLNSFQAFLNNAKEKADRKKLWLERLSKRQKKEQLEPEKLRAKTEGRRECEEEDALEKARSGVAEQPPAPVQRIEELRSSPADGNISPDSQSSGYSQRIDRERLKLQEQQRRRREVLANRIDIYLQSDVMAAFEEAIQLRYYND